MYHHLHLSSRSWLPASPTSWLPAFPDHRTGERKMTAKDSIDRNEQKPALGAAQDAAPGAAPPASPPAPVQEPAPPPSADGKRPAADAPHPEPPARSRFQFGKLVPLLVLGLAAAILFSIAGSWNSWVGAQTIQTTDDAQLRADITPLSTKVSGTVARVMVQDFQHVKAGELLVELNSKDFRAQVGQAEAAMRAAQAAIESNRRQKELQNARIEQARAGMEAARAA